MKCGVGDKVRFLNEVGGGVVSKILDKNKVMVMTEDGFEIPTLEAELVIIEKGDLIHNKPSSISKMETGDNLVKPSQKNKDSFYSTDESKKGLLENDIYLALLPVNQTNNSYDSRLEVYIVNNSNYSILYSLAQEFENHSFQITQGALPSKNISLVKEFIEREINKPAILRLQMIFYQDSQHTYRPSEDVKILLNEYLRSEYKCFMESLDKLAYCIPLNDAKMNQVASLLNQNEMLEVVKQKDTSFKPLPKKIVQKEVEEVDLHIHEIVDDYKNLTPGDIIKIQLNRFETSIEGGVRSKTLKKMVFIHGLGNGKLKQEIRKLLDSKYSKLRYQDASFKEYGYGATLVYLK